MSNKVTKNTIFIRDNIAHMILTSNNGRNLVTLFDIEDIPRVESVYYRWHAWYEKRSDSHYAIAPGRIKGERKTVRLARIIMNCPGNMVVDHANHDTLDNRKSNLKIVSQHANLINKKGAYRNSKSGIRGVHFHKASGKWCASVQLNGKHVYQKLHDDFNDACKDVEIARRNIHVSII